jgi:hypothetical protein
MKGHKRETVLFLFAFLFSWFEIWNLSQPEKPGFDVSIDDQTVQKIIVQIFPNYKKKYVKLKKKCFN